MLILTACTPAVSNPTNPTNNPATQTTGISATSSLKDLKGKPTVVLFGSTGCPHCRDAMPDFESKIYTPNKDIANVWVNVVDGKDGKKFENDVIAQGFNKNLVFNDITGEECGYVPSWLILDKDGKLAESACGNGDMDMVANKLQELL